MSPHELSDEEKSRLLRSLSCSPKTRRRGDPSEAARAFVKFDKDQLHTANVTASSPCIDDIDGFVNVPLDTPTIEHPPSGSIEDPAAIRRNTTATASKPGVLRSLLKRANSAPKKLTITKLSKDNTTSTPASPSAPPPLPPLNSPTSVTCCHPFVDKLKTMADKQLNKVTHKRSIKRVNLDADNKIVLEEKQRILKLRESPKADRREFASYVEKRDSDEIMEILELDESPSEVRKRRFNAAAVVRPITKKIIHADGIVPLTDDVPDVLTAVAEEVVALPPSKPETNIHLIEDDGKEPTIAELLEEEFKNDPPTIVEAKSEPPKKSPRRQKDHIYEDIENPDDKIGAVEAIITQRVQEEQRVAAKSAGEYDLHENVQEKTILAETHDDDIDTKEATNERTTSATDSLLNATVESLQKDDEDLQLSRLSAVTEVSEYSNPDASDEKPQIDVDQTKVTSIVKQPEIKSVLKSRESSLGPDKRVTFSPSTEEREEESATKEDVSLPDHITHVDKRWSNMR